MIKSMNLRSRIYRMISVQLTFYCVRIVSCLHKDISHVKTSVYDGVFVIFPIGYPSKMIGYEGTWFPWSSTCPDLRLGHALKSEKGQGHHTRPHKADCRILKRLRDSGQENTFPDTRKKDQGQAESYSIGERSR